MAPDQRNKPFDPSEDYTMMPNAIYRLYMQIPEFKPVHALAYVFLCSRWNANYGYAFPDTFDIAAALDCGVNKVSDVKKTLVDVGLVEVVRRTNGFNDVYLVKAAITDPDVFYERFPEATTYRDQREEQFSKRRTANAEAKRVFDERRRSLNSPLN